MQAVPVIPWLGGKRRLAAQLFPLFPQHDCYVELFCGGAALYFLRPVPAKTEVLNDINGELVNLYRVVQHHLLAFIEHFKWLLHSRQTFEWEQTKRPETLTDIQRAVRFYYLQQHAFGGRVEGQTFGTATTAPAFSLMRIEETLGAAWQRMASTTVENLSWDDCLDRYDRDHTFFYADPPYWQTEGYGVEFGWHHYESLAAKMASMKGKLMMSINDHPAIRERFGAFTILDDIDIKYSVANNHGTPQTSKELVICNFQPGEGGLFG